MKLSAYGLLAALALVVFPLSALAQAVDDNPWTAAMEAPSDLELAARQRLDQRRDSTALDPLVDNATPLPHYTGPGPGHAPVESPWAHLGLYGNVFYWMYGGPQYFNPPPPPPPGPGAKNGMLQRVILTESWLADGDDLSAMGVNDVELKTVLALPVGCLATPLLVTPGVGAHYFDGPLTTDVPGHTYDFYMDIRWIRQVSQCVSLDLGFTPGWYSDLEQSNDDALRLGARGTAFITCSPTLQLAIGAVYLDRDDVPVLPLGGVLWMPNPDLKLELVAPRPRIARRLSGCGDCGWWLYVAGEFGGGSWAIQRVTGAEDVLNYRDYRAILGLERTAVCGLTGRVEAGYVFEREIEYQSNSVSFDLEDTFMLRAELSY